MTSAKRIDLAAKLWGWRPHPSQREWLLDEHPVKVAACGRRWGKTESAAIDVATYAIARNRSCQIIVAPTYDQSKLISRTVERLLLGHPELRRHTSIVRTPYTEIRFRKSRIMARTADDDGRNLRGHSANRVVVDEAAFVRGEVIDEVIGPMLADANGSLVLISTPFGQNHFYETFLRGWRGGVTVQSDSTMSARKNRYRSFQFPSWENPHISREYIEAQREVLTERQFKAEYEAEFLDSQNSVFCWEDIHCALVGKGLADVVAHVAGVDWARYSDYTAVAVVAVALEPFVQGRPNSNFREPLQREPRFQVVHLERFNQMEWAALVKHVARVLTQFRVSAVLADQTSVGDPLIENLQQVLWHEYMLDARIEGVVFTNQAKRELIDNLALCLARREIILPRDEQLLTELKYYQYELTESGNVRMAARRGYHDDCVCALALAIRAAPRPAYPGNLQTSGHLRDSMRGW